MWIGECGEQSNGRWTMMGNRPPVTSEKTPGNVISIGNREKSIGWIYKRSQEWSIN